MNNIDVLWNMFKKTGDVRYYNLIKKIEGKVNEDSKNRRNSSR